MATAVASRIQRVVAAQRAELRAIQQQIIRGSAASSQDVAAIRATTRELVAQLKASGDTDDAAKMRSLLDDSQLFAALEQQATQTNSRILTATVTALIQAQQNLASVAQKYLGEMANIGRPADATIRLVPVQATANVAAILRPDSPFRGLKALSQHQIDGIGQQLIDGVANGQHPMRIARSIVDEVVGVPESRARTIARTETMRAYRGAASAAMQASPAITGWVWTTTGNPCAACLAMSGATFGVDVVMDSHPNCQCIQVPTTVGWDGSPDGDGATSADSLGIPSGADVFAAMTPAQQLATLGPGKYAMWQTGKFQLSDFAHTRRSADWGNSVTRASAVQARANRAARIAARR